jgi:hypothetical protein
MNLLLLNRLTRGDISDRDFRNRVFRNHFALVPLVSLGFALAFLSGCGDDTATVRKIQASRQARQQAETKVDHIGEAMNLVSRLVDLDQTSASRQIVYHLNAWNTANQSQTTSKKDDASTDALLPSDLLSTVSDLLPMETASQTILEENFTTLDVLHLRDMYLHRQVTNWVLELSPADPLWEPWLKENREKLGAEHADSLASALKLFDWVTRNIALEPLVLKDPAPPSPPMPLGMTFRGAGYRQTPHQTLFRGTGDALQRSLLFISLCRQASLPACMLGVADGSGNLSPWLAGVLIGDQIYLFECSLGLPVPGPGQSGVATLADARKDASVLRRLNVPGWFEYPIQKDDVQQCAALLALEPAILSLRAKRLQDALTGELRTVLHEDASQLAASFEAISGIASARIWDVPIKSRVYESAIQKISETDPMIGFFTYAPWSVLEGEFDQAKRLARGRWRHLQGIFADDEMQSTEGAKPLYLSQRQPEFEIADLRIDVELQMQYGIRRELGVTPEIYDQQIQQVQSIMRQGKNTATFWLSLLQFETGRFDLAQNWFGDRVLDDGQESRWEEAARYNLARSREHLGKPEEAIELYKFEGMIQEHGNRIRARLLNRSQADES